MYIHTSRKKRPCSTYVSVADAFLFSFFLLGFFGLLVWFVSLRAKTERRRNDVKQGKCVNEAKYND